MRSFTRLGVIRIDTLGEMFDVASLLVSQPVPKGSRVAIVTNAGGAGILAADACAGAGLQVPELGPEIQAELRSFLSPEAGVRNPVDMIASATAEDYAKAIRAVSKDSDIDAIVILFVPPIAIMPEDVAKQILTATAELKGRIPVIANFMATHGMPEMLIDGPVKVPSYPFPEVAIRALARAVSYGKWLQRPVEAPRRVRRMTARRRRLALVAKSLATGADWLHPEEAERLLECYGVPVVRTMSVASAEEAGRAAASMGGGWSSRTADGPRPQDRGRCGGAGSRDGGAQVRLLPRRWQHISPGTGTAVSGFLVQPMLQQGVEMIVGATTDPTFGPVVACGAGGTLVELMKDVSIRITPVTPLDASEMLHDLKTFPLLEGYRGAPACDVPALEEVVQRVSALADDIPEVIELDLNPVMVGPEGASVVDFRVRLGERWTAVPLGAVR